MLPIQCRMARAGLDLGVRKLASAAKVSPDTVVRFERGERIRKRTIDSLRQVLEAAGGVHRRTQAGRENKRKVNR